MTLTRALLVICLADFVYSQVEYEPQSTCDSFSCGQPIQNATTNATNVKPTYAFDDPETAYKILEQLDIYTPLTNNFFRTHDGIDKSYDKVFLGIQKDKNYCKIHRAYFCENPEAIFNEVNYFADHNQDNFVKTDALAPVANNSHPECGYHMRRSVKKDPHISLNPNINFFFTTETMFEFLRPGKHFSCLTQASGHIPGHWSICRKDFAAESVMQYAKQYENRPQCFQQDKYFPKTWLLYQKESCQEFFAEFNSPQYQAEKEKHRVVYLKKVAVWSHRGDGVSPVYDEEESALRETYKNGKLCGEINEVVIMQKYVPNPLLINGRKFDFRMFMFIASMNPLIAYFYDGGLRVSLVPYDVNSQDKKSLLTNFALNHEIYDVARKEGAFKGRTEDELKYEQQWDFPQFTKYLYDSGVVSDPNWLENYLRPQFSKAYIHLIRLARHSYLNTSSSVYEFYGADFMIDDEMNIWFIEANSGPAFGGYTKEFGQVVAQTLRDHVEIIMGLLRSRAKRIINFVNQIIREDQVEQLAGDEIKIKNLDEKIQEFQKITKNYFEPEFEPSKTNGFVKIIDENLEGADAYMGYLPAECL